jgi:hypothetical protein
VVMLLPQQAVFTAISGPQTDQSSSLRVCHERAFDVSRR